MKNTVPLKKVFAGVNAAVCLAHIRGLTSAGYQFPEVEKLKANISTLEASGDAAALNTIAEKLAELSKGGPSPSPATPADTKYAAAHRLSDESAAFHKRAVPAMQHPISLAPVAETLSPAEADMRKRAMRQGEPDEVTKAMRRAMENPLHVGKLL